jgi:hypothetical protein
MLTRIINPLLSTLVVVVISAAHVASLTPLFLTA